MADDINAERLTKMTNELIAAISAPPFVAAMKELKVTPTDQRLALASKRLTPTVLSAAGVKFPQGMRITSRYFEPGTPDIIEVTDHGAVLRHVNSLPGTGATAAWACACGGAATVCGGAGGGS
jgi:hypothetical protein